jgi:nucleotide-binding universal stress UspA family protein
VGGIGLHKIAYLTLDELTADPKLARRLPPDLAWRCHALPLAEDNGRVTVAMADPEDTEAREAVVAALGPKSCVVKGPSSAIDARLAEIWGEEARRPLKLTVCDFPEPLPHEWWNYIQALGALLDSQLDCISTAKEMNALIKEGVRANCDLVIFGKSCHSPIRRLLSRSSVNGAPALQQSAVPFAILVAQRPRWPLQRILLAICGDSVDDAAMDWALRLARPSTAAVTVLAVVPPVPTMYHGLARMEQSMAALLTTDTALGRQMHHVARRLAECNVDGTLRLRQGAPDQEICREVVEGNHDLVVMATRPCRWWLRQLGGDPICSLLSRVDRPVLLAEPTAT